MKLSLNSQLSCLSFLSNARVIGVHLRPGFLNHILKDSGSVGGGWQPGSFYSIGSIRADAVRPSNRFLWGGDLSGSAKFM